MIDSLDSQVLSYVKLILLTVACELQVQAKFINKKMNLQKHANGHERPSIIIFRKFPLPSKGLTAGCHLKA